MGTKRVWHGWSALALTLVALGGVGCLSAPRLRVDKDVLDKITTENKLLLFDAENELNIAIDSRDQVVDEIEQIKEGIDRTKKKRSVALRDADTFADRGDAEKANLASMRADASDARLDYLRSRLDWAREKLAKERAKLIVARAQFELAKAQLVKKNNVPGASDLELADFEAQVQSLGEDVNSADEDIKEAEAEMKEKEAAWSERAKALQAASGGALGSLWID